VASRKWDSLCAVEVPNPGDKRVLQLWAHDRKSRASPRLCAPLIVKTAEKSVRYEEAAERRKMRLALRYKSGNTDF